MTTEESISKINALLDDLHSALEDATAECVSAHCCLDSDDAADSLDEACAYIDMASDATSEISACVDAISRGLPLEADMLDALLDVHRVAVLAVERGDLAELAEVLRDDGLRALFDRWHRVVEEAV